MDNFPPLSEQITWIIFLSILSIFALVLIGKKKLLSLPKTPASPIQAKDVAVGFGFYLFLYYGIAPFLIHLFQPYLLKNPLESLSLFQLLFVTLVSSFLICYLKFRKISLITRPDSFFQALVKVALYLLVIFPLVSLIGQVVDTLLYVYFNVKGYEQVAVTFLKKSIEQPFTLACSFISIVILAPLTEELLFRGILLNFLKNKLGQWGAILLSGFIFALFHFSPEQGLGNLSLITALTFFGIMLGGFYLMTTSLIYPILLHAIFNFISSLRIIIFDT